MGQIGAEPLTTDGLGGEAITHATTFAGLRLGSSGDKDFAFNLHKTRDKTKETSRAVCEFTQRRA